MTEERPHTGSTPRVESHASGQHASKQDQPEDATEPATAETDTQTVRTFSNAERIAVDPFSECLRVTEEKRDGADGKQYLVRKVHARFLDQEDARARLIKALAPLEGKTAPQLPGLLTHFDTLHILDSENPKEDGLFLLEPCPQGRTLRELLDERRLSGEPMSADEVSPLLLGIAAALEAIPTPWRHGALLPSHIFVDEDGSTAQAGRDDRTPLVTVTAPYLAAALPAGAVAAALQEGPPTTPFFAPEVFKGLPHPTSDLYSVGALVFEALTGRTPKPGETPRRELGDLGDAVASLLVPSPAERSDSLDPLRAALGLPEAHEVTHEEAIPESLPAGIGDDSEDPYAEDTGSDTFDARRTQVDADAPVKFGLPVDLKATQVDTSLPLALQQVVPGNKDGGQDTEETRLTWDEEAGNTTPQPAAEAPRVNFSDLDPSLVRLALGADPGSDAGMAPTTPGTIESPSVEQPPYHRERADTQPDNRKNDESVAAATASEEEVVEVEELELDVDDQDQLTHEQLTQPLGQAPKEVLAKATQPKKPASELAEAPTPPPEETEATVEQRPRRRPETMARTMLDVRAPRPRNHIRTLAFILGCMLVAVAVYSVSQWVRRVRENALEERRLQRKLERLEQIQQDPTGQTTSPGMGDSP